MGLDLRSNVGVKENVTTFVPITGCHFFMLENWEKGCCTVKLPVLYKLSHKSEKKGKSLTHLVLIPYPGQEDKIVYRYRFTYEHAHENPN